MFFTGLALVFLVQEPELCQKLFHQKDMSVHLIIMYTLHTVWLKPSVVECLALGHISMYTSAA